MNSKIKTSLPFCLYKIDDRVYEVKDRDNTKIRFIKQKIEPSRRTSRSKNIEFLRDRWGIDAYSKVEIETDREFTESIGSKEAKDFALKIINRFIKLYRYFDSDAVHLTSLIREDLIDEFKLHRKDGKGSISISFGGGLTPLHPNKIAKVSDNIEGALEGNFEIPLWEDLLLNAGHYIFTGEYRMSILESVIALELVVSNFIREEGKKKTVSRKKIEGFIKDVGVSGNIEVTIQLLAGKGKSDLPNDKAFEKCKTGITIRNAIVHKGRTSVTPKEARETLEVNKLMVKSLLRFEGNSKIKL